MTSSKFTPLILIFIILLLAYSNSFQSEWHFDDYPNIVNNQNVHLKNLNWDSLKKTFLGRTNKISRPLAYLTFGLNWFYYQDKVLSYHLINFFIHLVTSILLFYTLLYLFKTPRLKFTPNQDVFFIALLSSVFWSLHPIQVQAVTYIVQRMASMATMFYLLGILMYLKGRIEEKQNKKVLFYCTTVLAFLFALTTKQNTIVFPISLILIELCFFNDLNLYHIKKNLFTIILPIAFIGLISIYFFLDGNLDNFLAGYENRNFTLYQRLLTELRVLIFYLSQLFYPVVTRLSITHDIELSSSFFHPWTTIVSFLIIFFLLAIAKNQIKQRPLISFAIFFYFLNHLIESTIIPLEIIFEHRNYLPSLFILAPIVFGIKKTLNYYYANKKSMYVIISSSLALLLIFFGFGTYIRNMSWATEKALWQDAIEKAPNSARPRQNLATFYTNQGQLEKGYLLNKQAISLNDPKPKSSESLSYYNMAGIHLKKNEYNKAIHYYKKAILVRPDYFNARYALAISYLKLKKIDQASKVFGNSAKVDFQSTTNFFNIKTLIALKEKKYQRVIGICGQVISNHPDNIKSYIYISDAFKNIKRYKQARFFLNRAFTIAPKNIYIMFQILDNEIKANNLKNIDDILNKLINKFSLPFIENKLAIMSNDPLYPVLNKNQIIKIISNRLKKISESFTTNKIDYSAPI